MHDFRTGSGHLQKFVVGDSLQLLRIFNDARIAGEHAIDVGEDLAGIGIQRAGQRDRGQIGTATAERGCFAFGVCP